MRCMYVYICICICMYIYIFICIYTYIYIHMYIYICIYIYTCICTCRYVYRHIHTDMYTYACISMILTLWALGWTPQVEDSCGMVFVSQAPFAKTTEALSKMGPKGRKSPRNPKDLDDFYHDIRNIPILVSWISHQISRIFPLHFHHISRHIPITFPIILAIIVLFLWCFNQSHPALLLSSNLT